MATTARDTNALVKEKTGISASNSRTPNSQKSTTRQSSSIDHHHKVKSRESAPAAASKNVPNYLRPTVSSRPESFKYVPKKTTTSTAGPGHDQPDTTTNKQQPTTTSTTTLQRRRSFDKPPSASRVTKALVSPVPSRERIMVPARSSSFSPKTSATSPKPAVDKMSKSRSLKSQASLTKNVKKSTVNSAGAKKETSSASASKKAAISSQDVEVKKEHIQLVVNELTDDEKIVDIETEVPVIACEVTKLSDDDDHDKERIVVDHVLVEDEKLSKSCDISTVTSDENLSVHQNVETQETRDDESSHEDTKINTEHDSEEENHHHPEEISLENNEEAKIEAAGDEVDKEEEEEAYTSVSGEELITGDMEEKVEEKEKDDENNEAAASEESTTVNKPNEGEQPLESGIEEVKTPDQAAEKNNAASSTRQGGNKKESPAAYNDVIEETASKLLEKRKNKVRALVGAFETVIDYETAASK